MHLMKIKESGLTLIELMISSILIGIVMIGVISFSYSIKTQQDSAKHLTLLKTQATTAVSIMKNDAAEAIGDAINPGIWCFAGGGAATTGSPCSRSAGNDLFLCFRKIDGNVPPTLTDYSDDSWSCYFPDMSDTDGDGNSDDTIWKCPVNYSGTSAPSGYSNCTSTATALLLETNNDDFAQIIYDASNAIVHVQITLETLSDRSQPYHPIKNPGHDVTAYLTPLSHSK